MTTGVAFRGVRRTRSIARLRIGPTLLSQDVLQVAFASRLDGIDLTSG